MDVTCTGRLAFSVVEDRTITRRNNVERKTKNRKETGQACSIVMVVVVVVVIVVVAVADAEEAPSESKVERLRQNLRDMAHK